MWKRYIGGNRAASSIPLYERRLRTPLVSNTCSGIGAGGGIWDAKVLPSAGAQVAEDFNTRGSCSYSEPLHAKKELISFKTVNIVKQKVRYVTNNGYSGTVLYWDLSSNYVGSHTLMSTAVSQYSGLDQTRNHLYPGSQFANLRSCMGGCPASANAVTTTTTPHGNITTDSLPSSPCNDLYMWDHVIRPMLRRPFDESRPSGTELNHASQRGVGRRWALHAQMGPRLDDAGNEI